MRRTEQVQGLRLMKFEEVYGRTHRGGLSQAEAAEVLGVSERTFRRWRDRYEAEGADGLYDRRLGRLSARRAPVDEVARVLELFDTRYWDFTAKHFHEKLVADHGFKRSYNWLRLSLQAHGRRRAAPRRGAHRRKRPRRALPGMMLHQDGSSHEWVPGRWWDLIVTMDDATSDIYSAFFVAEEGTMSSFQGVSEAIRAKGLFCSLYADRASHYWNTPEAGGKVDKDTPTQVGRALAQLGIELIPAYSPEARGRSERMFGTLQKRLPQELRLAGITDMVEANRFLKEVFLPQHNARFATPAEDRGTAFVPFTGALDDILCIHEERTVSNDNTVRYKRLALQIPAGRHRRHYVNDTVSAPTNPTGAALPAPSQMAINRLILLVRGARMPSQRPIRHSAHPDLFGAASGSHWQAGPALDLPFLPARRACNRHDRMVHLDQKTGWYTRSFERTHRLRLCLIGSIITRRGTPA